MVKMSCIVVAMILSSTPALADQSPAKSKPATGVARTSYSDLLDKDFIAADSTKDGKLSLSELAQFRQSRVQQRAQQANAAQFKRLDKDKNSYLSAEEFGALVANPPKIDAKPLLQRFDKNKDGQLTKEEYRASALADFDRMDVNGDGVLVRGEGRSATPSR